MRISDWSSDLCSSDLVSPVQPPAQDCAPGTDRDADRRGWSPSCPPRTGWRGWRGTPARAVMARPLVVPGEPASPARPPPVGPPRIRAAGGFPAPDRSGILGLRCTSLGSQIAPDYCLVRGCPLVYCDRVRDRKSTGLKSRIE